MQVNWFSMRDKNRRFFYIFCVFVSVAHMAPASWADSNSSGKLSVYVVNYPLQYFAERIGGEHVNVVFPAPADVDPAFWMPDAPTIAAYQQADLILLNGAGYAGWINKVTLPRFRMVNTSAGFKERYIEAAGILTHSHGSGGEHAHESLAFTTWIDFSLAGGQARTIAEALSRKRPDLRDNFQKNYAALEQDLMALDRTLKQMVSKDSTRPLVVSHPVYDYFARRYGLNIKSVHWEPDESPTNKQIMVLNRILKEHPAKWMLWEGKPIQESVERLQAAGVDSLVFDPCGNTPDQGDFLSVMRQNFDNLKLAFKID
jgi:zinc transport system substrate-binding protein